MPKRPWLKARLRALEKTPTALTRHLGLPASQIYEVIAGMRDIAPEWVEPMAAFLEWPVDELREHLKE
jgi:plasmid maintenance system antidote protein VapI